MPALVASLLRFVILVAGNLDFVTSGVSNMMLLWSRTGGQVKAVSAVGAVPLILVTRNPNVKTIADFTEKDKIAVDELAAKLVMPGYAHTQAPNGTLKYAEQMFKTGVIKTKPASWKDVFFPVAHGLPGN